MNTTCSNFTPERFLNTINAYYNTAAVKTAIELELFTIIGEEALPTQTIATRAQLSERNTRILCNYLVAIGFLCKDNNHYFLKSDARLFLDKNSPSYLGNTIDFLLSPLVTERFNNLTAIIQGNIDPETATGVLAPEHPQWVAFARAMAPIMQLPARLLAELIDDATNQPLTILDVAAGHGLFGLSFAARNPNAETHFLDWANVLKVAKENAKKLNITARTQFLPGNFFETKFEQQYDIILLVNFLHHFDQAGCETILRKAHSILSPNGKLVIFEFVFNEDRLSPSVALAFSMMMLGTTPSGEVYTFSDLKNMLDRTGFPSCELKTLPITTDEKVIVALKG